MTTASRHTYSILERSELVVLDSCVNCMSTPYRLRTRPSVKARLKTDRYYGNRLEAFAAYQSARRKERR